MALCVYVPASQKPPCSPNLPGAPEHTNSHITSCLRSAACSIVIISRGIFWVIFLHSLETAGSTCPVHFYTLAINTVPEVSTSHLNTWKMGKKEPLLNFTDGSCSHKLGQSWSKTIFYERIPRSVTLASNSQGDNTNAVNGSDHLDHSHKSDTSRMYLLLT